MKLPFKMITISSVYKSFNIMMLLKVILICWGMWFLTITLGQAVEESYFPPIVSFSPSNMNYDGNNFCWTANYYRYRKSYLLRSETTITDKKGNTSDTSILSLKNDNYYHGMNTGDSLIGQKNSRLCVVIPPDLFLQRPLVLKREFVNKGFLGLWDVQVSPEDININ